MIDKTTIKGRQLSFAAFIVLVGIVFVGTASAATLTVNACGGCGGYDSCL